MPETPIKGRVGTPLPHESAHLHVSGEARYIDDIPEPIGTLHAAINDAFARSAQSAINKGHIVNGQPLANGNRPGDDFNRRADWHDILTPHGWVPVRQRGDITDWRTDGEICTLLGKVSQGNRHSPIS